MKRRSYFRNSIALVLSLLLLLGAFPTQIIALDPDIPATESVSSAESAVPELLVDSQEYISDELIGEVAEELSLREENVKHFRLPNGTYEAVVYGGPVHRRDANGAWQDIDNTLSLVSSGASRAFRTPDSRVSFASAFKANESLLTLTENGYSITMAMLAAPLSGGLSADATATLVGEATVTNAPSRPAVFDSIEQAARIDNKSSVLYQGVLPNTSIEYILKGNDVKENIIVSAPSGSYEYDFQLTLVGLSAELDGKGNVRLCDAESGASRYVIPAPYMYDADGVYSEAVSYELYTVKEGLYLLRVSADASWINADGRAFPVTIDPTIEWEEWVNDVYVDSEYPDYNYDCLEELWVSDTQTTFIYMPLPSIPSGAFLQQATLCVPYYFPNTTTGSLLAGAYQVLEWWDPDVTTYENASIYSENSLDTVVLTASASITESNPGVASFLITQALENWYASSGSDYGIAITREESEEHTNPSVVFKAYEAGLSEDSYMIIDYVYRLPNGVYAIRNDQYPQRWMTVEDDDVWAGSHVQQFYSQTPPSDRFVFDRSSLFKICRVGDTGRYIIRSMLNNSLSIGISGGEIITKEISSVDADVAPSDTFCIEWDGQGFLLYPYGSTQVITLSGTTEADLSTVSRNYASTSARWSFSQYTSLHRQGSSLHYSDPMTVGTTVTITPIVWATNIDYNTPEISVIAEYADKATCTWNASSRTGALALHDDGTLKIRCHIYNGAHTSDRSSAYNLYPSLVVEEGFYFIKNKAAEKHIQIDDDDAPDYDTPEAEMELHDYDGGEYHRWQLIHVIDGYYKILSVKSGLVICADPDFANVSGGAFIQESYSDTAGMTWKVVPSDSGAYILKPQYYTSLADWCMSAGNQTTGDLKVQQEAYTNDSDYKDEWELQPIIYGVQPFRELSEAINDSINCHGYALMRNDNPQGWYTTSMAYANSVSKNNVLGENDYSASIQKELSENAKEDFENWLVAKEYDWEPESTFTGTDSDAVLAPNQYRVVLRTGLHNIATVLGGTKKLYDYHFWYQTYDGRWANKHGESGIPELLPIGTTPFTEGSSGWTLTSNGTSYTYFYNSPIYSYIITIDE